MMSKMPGVLVGGRLLGNVNRRSVAHVRFDGGRLKQYYAQAVGRSSPYHRHVYVWLKSESHAGACADFAFRDVIEIPSCRLRHKRQEIAGVRFAKSGKRL